MTDPHLILADVSDYLGVTWDDQRLLKQIEDGMNLIQDYTDSDLDFMDNAQAKELLFSYVRYTRAHSTEWFEDNFKSRLLALQYREAIKWEDENGISEISVP